MAYQIEKEINFSLASQNKNISRCNSQWIKRHPRFVKINTYSWPHSHATASLEIIIIYQELDVFFQPFLG